MGGAVREADLSEALSRPTEMADGLWQEGVTSRALWRKGSASCPAEDHTVPSSQNGVEVEMEPK